MVTLAEKKMLACSDRIADIQRAQAYLDKKLSEKVERIALIASVLLSALCIGLIVLISC